MASLELSTGSPLFVHLLAHLRRFIRLLTSPQVVLSLVMLCAMFYMVIVPLYRMLAATITLSENDLRYAPEQWLVDPPFSTG